MDFLLTSEKIEEYLDLAKNSIWTPRSVFHSGVLAFSILANHYQIDILLQSLGDNFSTPIFQKTIPTKIYNFYSWTLTLKEQKKAWRKCGKKVTYFTQSLQELLPTILNDYPNSKFGIFIDKHGGNTDWIIPYLSHPNIKLVGVNGIGKLNYQLGKKKERESIKKLTTHTTYLANTDNKIFKKCREIDNQLCANIPEWKFYAKKYPLGCGLGLFSNQPPETVVRKAENKIFEIDEEKPIVLIEPELDLNCTTRKIEIPQISFVDSLSDDSELDDLDAERQVEKSNNEEQLEEPNNEEPNNEEQVEESNNEEPNNEKQLEELNNEELNNEEQVEESNNEELNNEEQLEEPNNEELNNEEQLEEPNNEELNNEEQVEEPNNEELNNEEQLEESNNEESNNEEQVEESNNEELNNEEQVEEIDINIPDEEKKNLSVEDILDMEDVDEKLLDEKFQLLEEEAKELERQLNLLN